MDITANRAPRPAGMSDMIVGRAKVIWGRPHWRIVSKAFDFLSRHDIGVVVACRTCQQVIERSIDPATGDLHLRCNHADRVVRAAQKGWRH